MKTMEIPAPIKNAAANMLRDYIPGLTADKLEAALYLPDEDQPAPEKLLTRKEAAVALSVSLPSVDRLLAEGGLARVKIRGAVRIKRSAIDKLIQG